jgi:hypothetical protein
MALHGQPEGTNKNAGLVTATAAGALDLIIFIMKVKVIRPGLPPQPLLPAHRRAEPYH